MRRLGARRHGRFSPPATSAAQSPMAKTLSSRVVCKVGRTTSWLIRLVSSPSRSFRKSAALTPAAHTTSSAGMNRRRRAARRPGRPRSRGAGTDLHAELAEQRPSRRQARRQRRQTRSAASIRVILMSLSGSMRSSPRPPLRASCGAARRPVDPGRAGADDGDLQLVRPHRLGLSVGPEAGVDQPAWKRCACSGVSRHIACSVTPGVPKSLVRRCRSRSPACRSRTRAPA